MKKQTRPLQPEARERALDALALSRREGLSLTKASRMTGTSRRTVLRHVGQAYQREGRRWVPRQFDRLAREMTALTAAGPHYVQVRDSRTASLLAEHANAVKAYRDTGDEVPLRSLRRRSVQIDGRRYELVVDPEALDRLIEGGELHYELYRR